MCYWHAALSKVACALLLSGENLDNYGDVENILVEMGTYFQVQVTPILLTSISLLSFNMIVLYQDDYLDCYGDPEFIGKVGAFIYFSNLN